MGRSWLREAGLGGLQTKLNSKGRRNKRKNCCRQGRAKAWGVEGADEFKFRRGEKERKKGCRKGRAKGRKWVRKSECWVRYLYP